jgi:catechol 2,3-dioxygenase-like lactoylglutathione lyase family enzyme
VSERPDLARTHLRVARPSDDLDAVVRFYRDGLGFDVLYEFRDHDGFDGVMLGRPGAAYHLEFTTERRPSSGTRADRGQPPGLLPARRGGLAAAVARMEKAGHRPVKAFNPYWDRKGLTFEDPDGYRVVLQNEEWNAG